MKSRALATGLIVLAVAAVPRAGAEGGTKHVRINLDDPASAGAGDKPSSSAPTPGASNTAKAAAPAKKPAPKIEGMEVSRGDRGYLGVKIEDGTFRVHFYDKNKEPVAPDVAQIALRWPVQYQRSPERTLLVPSEDGKVMTSAKVVRPPFSFKLYLTLLKDTSPGSDADAETYVVDFRQ